MIHPNKSHIELGPLISANVNNTYVTFLREDRRDVFGASCYEISGNIVFDVVL